MRDALDLELTGVTPAALDATSARCVNCSVLSAIPSVPSKRRLTQLLVRRAGIS